jgi:hypothetical protein
MTARVAGALFIVATAAAVSSVMLINSPLDDPDYLTEISGVENRILLALDSLHPRPVENPEVES